MTTKVERGVVLLRMPGRVFAECFDPRATGVPAEMGWPEGTRRRSGRGVRVSFYVTPAQRIEMLDHAQDFAEALSGGVDPECAAAMRAVLRWVASERAKLGVER
jgi:hypothetical protein